MAKLQVELADPAITVHGWTRELDKLGHYNLKIRKTPEELKAEKERLKAVYGGKPKVNPIRTEAGSVIEHDPEDPSTVYFLPGLWPRVKTYLDTNHIEYEIIVDKRDPSIRPPINFEAIKDVQFRETQDLALALVATSDCGIIETTTGWGKSYLIGIICKAFPTLNILICTSSIAVVETLYKYLCQQVPGEVGILTGMKDTSHDKRVVVCTLRSLSKIPREAPHLILCDECHDVGATQSGTDLMQFCFSRRFGFTASPYRNDGSQLVLESIFGPTILKMTYDEAKDSGMVVPMKYTMLPCDWVPDICRKQDIGEVIMKRFAYWRNTARNRAIANFIQKLHKIAPDIQILIICSTLEHCIALHLLLPWFHVLFYGNANQVDLLRHFPKEKYPNLDLSQYKMTQKQLEIGRAAFAKGTLKFVISTMILKQGVSANHLQVLVRADGATSKIMGIQIPGRLSRLDEGKEYGYLIDLEDTGCPWTKRRALTREQLYKEQQWTKIQPEDILHDFAGRIDTNDKEST